MTSFTIGHSELQRRLLFNLEISCTWHELWLLLAYLPLLSFDEDQFLLTIIHLRIYNVCILDYLTTRRLFFVHIRGIMPATNGRYMSISSANSWSEKVEIELISSSASSSVVAAVNGICVEADGILDMDSVPPSST